MSTSLPTSDYYNLGSHTRPISTTSDEAQIWFDRGLNWTYAFNHEEAIRCFRTVLEHDPNCAMAHWGIAYAIGPNYNKEWDAFDATDLEQSVATAYEETQAALALLDRLTAAERGLITALQARYPSATPAEDCASWNEDYAVAMRAVYHDFGDDLDIAALYAEALMNRTPWKLWNLKTGEAAEGASTLEAREVLERAFENPSSRRHPGVLHMYIHLMEMSPTPEAALRAADWLRGLVPDGGHLEHMPTHIDVLCGHYQNVVDWNSRGIIADRKYLARQGAMNYYTGYRAHNYHFKLYGAMFLGQYEAAIEAADELVATIPNELFVIETPPVADRLEGFMSMKMHAYIRFGKWQEIIDTPLPEDQTLYCVTTTMIHYAKGVAYSATGRIAEAEEQRRLFDAAYERVPETRMLFNNTCRDILAIAREMLNGELEYRKGNFPVAYDHLRQAVELDDGLPYDEPWGWMQPARHALGALLLEQGHVEEAEAVYRADLGFDSSLPRTYQHPENVWSLHGYHECLMRLDKHHFCPLIKQRLDLAIARADVPIEASCYCRVSA